MNAQQKSKWVKALRSGRYEQTTGTLTGSRNMHCCLGVANRVLKLGVNTFDEGTLRKNAKSIFLDARIQGALVDFNDIDEMPFDLIAGFIDCYVEPTE